MKTKFIFLIALFCNQSYPFIHKVESLAYCNEETGVSMPPKLYLLDDFHYGHEEVHPHQRNALLHFIRQTGSSFIAESETTKNNEKLTIRELHKQTRHLRHPFFYLSRLTAYNGTITTNVDFRPNHNTLDTLKKTANIQIKKILTYDDPSVLTQYYREVITTHKNLIAPACHFLYDNLDRIDSPEVQAKVQSLFDFHNPAVQTKNMDSTKELVKEVSICYNLELVDLEILHALVEHGKQKVPSTVIYAGGAHIKRIKPILTKLGYRLVSAVALWHENDTVSNLYDALHTIEPCYNPEEKLPKTIVDFLLTYISFKYEHPHWAIAIPSTILAAVIGIVGCLVKNALSSDNTT